ncbi:MAG: hypothetical protein ACLGIJ_10045 [Candidatus Limnocylindria bacterium]
MAAAPLLRTPNEIEVRSGPTPAGPAALTVILVIAIAGTVALLRGGLLEDPLGLNGGAEYATPPELIALSADVLEQATTPGAGGYRFEVLQTSTMVARPGGPRIPVPDAIGRGTAFLADRYFLHSMIEQGVVRPDGFWSQMRAGPLEGGTPDWTGSRIMFEALARDGVDWRNDGDGWYRSDGLPGIGLDPATAALLPDLLRGAADARDVPADDPKANPTDARTLEADAKPADIPGVIAADGLAFTRLTAPIAYGFDDAGRVVRITVTALNTNMTDHDLVIETTITIAYDKVGELPAAIPLRTGEGN